jgi:hypothetical protein
LDWGFCEIFLKEIDAAAGRPSGRRPFIATGGMGASAPIITSKDFDKQKISKLLRGLPFPLMRGVGATPRRVAPGQ